MGQKVQIKPFVEAFLKTDYVQGSAYYELTKTEHIQASKSICIQSKKDGSVYSGSNARSLLGLPDTEVKVSPVNTDYTIYVQSMSVNRNLMPGTHLLVVK